VAEVAWDDDTVDRWVLWWYRYDDERRQRRNTVVGAFTERAEFDQRMAEVADLLARLKPRGRPRPWSASVASSILLGIGRRCEQDALAC
jgi:hypothetical protein